MSYILPKFAPLFCMLNSVRMRLLGMASNRGHLDRYGFSKWLSENKVIEKWDVYVISEIGLKTSSLDSWHRVMHL